jgi:hypothetical protein
MWGKCLFIPNVGQIPSAPAKDCTLYILLGSLFENFVYIMSAVSAFYAWKLV